MSLPLNIEQAPIEELACIQGICFDIDDTFSSEGKILASTYEALWKLKEAGFKLIPVTGRPAGWCDHIVRFWPVDAIVGENGAFVFYMHEGKRQRFDVLSMSELRQAKESLKELARKIKEQFPYAQWASDQDYREFDLAIDFCEDVAPWKKIDIDRLVALCQKEQAMVKVSSIHVNTWYGVYDKQSTFDRWMKQQGEAFLGMKFNQHEWIYIGDSPNDVPAFQYFSKSVGVANLKNFFNDIEIYPTWICDYESGKGFEQLAERLLACR